MTAQLKKTLGNWGEEQVVQMLRNAGHNIICMQWRCPYGEIDIISEIEQFIVFTEVKLRKNAAHGQAREFVDQRKQEKIRKTALIYLMQNESSRQPRFDVAEVYAPQGQKTVNPSIIILENAF